MPIDDFNRIAIAQINICVGDINGNTDKLIKNIDYAKRELQADTIIFPELAISGYPPEDLLLRPDFHTQTRKALERICAATNDIKVVLGYSEKDGDAIYNVCSLIFEQEIIAHYRKRELPNYGVFDEKRYFTGGPSPTIVDIDDLKIALSICEDIWIPDYCEEAGKLGVDVLINVNASPYHVGKSGIREELICKRARDNNISIIYANLVGGQDELIFDGDSMIVGEDGAMLFRAPRFVEDIFIVERDKNSKQFSLLENSVNSPVDDENAVYQAIVLGVRDYVGKNGFHGAVIGLSGGIDSALTLAIAVDALGAENIEVLLMPSRYTADMSIDDSVAMAECLGVKHHVLSIEKPFDSFLELLEPVFAGREVDATEENIQARCRGILLMALSNKTGKLLLTTGNKSEMAVGYATLYGDMAGGFAPLKDLSKTLVYQLSRWRNQSQTVIPDRIIERPPSAELRPDQKDEDSLPAYDVLDPILEMYIENDQSPTDIIKAGFDHNVVNDVVRLVDRNEYKRRQAAPGVRITARAFGRDRRYPITSRYREKH